MIEYIPQTLKYKNIIFDANIKIEYDIFTLATKIKISTKNSYIFKENFLLYPNIQLMTQKGSIINVETKNIFGVSINYTNLYSEFNI